MAFDKPSGWTSHDVVGKVRGILGGVRVGHAGTLDPDATGVLLLCVGSATKVSAFLMESHKEYLGRGHLGIVTDTQDAAGQLVSQAVVECSAEEVRAKAAAFVGVIQQIPPMYSAVKVDGKKLYELARKGVTVERKPREVTVEEFEILSAAPPVFDFRLRCSKGTYARTLVHDLGEALGCGGHLAQLRRSRQAGYAEADLLPGEVLKSPDAGERILQRIRPAGEAFAYLPQLEMPRGSLLRVGSGFAVASGPSGLVRLVAADGSPRGLGRVGKAGGEVVFVFGAVTHTAPREAKS
ncbi:MAG: tRNA pseudouridine(55) synthase TruB [Gemmatimonadota bacterium]|nr:tRNA pseudouridine(55) synthase TruB [Gemmatimonadota bacterium]MDP6801820.1 tRNA pseudouridine(55) synthase TruB [Gemmatimonadota bacterium]MDP7031546.1 tRNA pseudouridine(55) synthase TruB [Gemmatimonadota bacterium]